MTWLNAMLKRFICSSNGRKTGEILAYSQRPTFNPETGKDFGKSGRTIYIKIHMNRALLLKHTA